MIFNVGAMLAEIQSPGGYYQERANMTGRCEDMIPLKTAMAIEVIPSKGAVAQVSY